MANNKNNNVSANAASTGMGMEYDGVFLNNTSLNNGTPLSYVNSDNPWARANNDLEFAYVNDTTHSSNSLTLNNSSDISLIMGIALSSIAMIAIASLIIKKEKI